MPYLSASAVVIHNEEALYQVYAPLPLPYLYQSSHSATMHCCGCSCKHTRVSRERSMSSRVAIRGVYPLKGNDANFTLPPLSMPFPLPSLPFPPSPPRGSGGRAPSGGGPGVTPGKMEIEIGFGAFWRIFVSKRQLNINKQIRAKRTYKLRMTHISGEFFPLQGVILFPLSPIWTQVASTSPLPVDAPGRNAGHNVCQSAGDRSV